MAGNASIYHKTKIWKIGIFTLTTMVVLDEVIESIIGFFIEHIKGRTRKFRPLMIPGKVKASSPERYNRVKELLALFAPDGFLTVYID